MQEAAEPLQVPFTRDDNYQNKQYDHLLMGESFWKKSRRLITGAKKIRMISCPPVYNH